MGRAGLRIDGMANLKIPGSLAVIVHGDMEEMSAHVAKRIEQIVARSMDARGICHIALAGGETPRRCYELLREVQLDWKHVQVYFGDERCLPSGDSHRNDSMAHAALLGHVAIPSGNVHAIPAERGAQVAAVDYARLLQQVLPLDLVLLGMGEDGHTASLFPDNPATDLHDIVVPVFNAPKPPAERVSLGMAALNSASEKIFLVAGKEKRDALAHIARGEPLPAARVRRAEWHIDRAAVPDMIA